ncbi:MAG: hypothetical protein P8X47_01590 [Ignavibacteriaceae bacterium]
MMRFLTIILLLAAIGGGLYYLFSMEVEDDIKVTGKLQISKQIMHQTSTSSEPIYFATVSGRVKNNLKRQIKNVFIKYEIDGHKVAATIFDLAPGQQVNFNTSGIDTDLAHPEIDFKGIYYD